MHNQLMEVAAINDRVVRQEAVLQQLFELESVQARRGAVEAPAADRNLARCDRSLEDPGPQGTRRLVPVAPGDSRPCIAYDRVATTQRLGQPPAKGLLDALAFACVAL